MKSKFLIAFATAVSIFASANSFAEKVYTVGTDAAFAPFEFKNAKGEIVGFDIEVMQAIADKSGIKFKFIDTAWDGLFDTLKTGDRDLVMSAVTIDEKRKKSMEFSAPYFETKQVIGVPLTSTVLKKKDLKGAAVGVQIGTKGDDEAKSIASARVKRFESMPVVFKSLQYGSVSAIITDNSVLGDFIKNNPNSKLKMIEDPEFAKEFYGIAAKKGNLELIARINKGLAAIKADGTYAKIYSKYFGK